VNTFVTIDEVFTSYRDQWVLLDELESKDNLTVQGGRVVGYDPERSVIEAMAIEKRLERCVIVCAKQKYGALAISRDYAVSPITSADEIEAEVRKA
jgi:hypothetical protein